MMDIKKHVRNYLLAALGTLGLICATNAQAGVLAFPIGADGPGFGPEGGVFEGNYIFGCGEGGIEVVDECDGKDLISYGKLIHEIDYVDLVFVVVGDLPNGDANGLNEVLVDEFIFNGTGIDWTDYHLELGYASIDFPENDCDSDVLECFDYEFIAPNPDDESLYFTNVAQTNDPKHFAENSFVYEDHPNMVWFDEGVYPDGGLDPFAQDPLELFADFAVPNVDSTDIPELAFLSDLACDGDCYGVVLRQIPSIAAVPEPSIIALFAAGLFGIGFARRRKA